MQIANDYIKNIKNITFSKIKARINFKGNNQDKRINISNPEIYQANYGIKTQSDNEFQIKKDEDGELSIQSTVKLQTGDYLLLTIDNETLDEF